MILVNLVPPELRKGKQAPWRRLYGKKVSRLGGGFFLLLTLIFYVQYQLGRMSLGRLETQWISLQKDVQRVAELKTSIEGGGKKEKEFLERYVTSPFPATAILSATSIFLPDSIWLVELKISRQPNESTFFLKGFSLPSPNRSGIQDIEKYLRDVKGGFPPKTELVLTTSRQVKEDRELTLFTAIFKWT